MNGPLLDHVVINARFDMDRAEQRFAALGFQVTARGLHTLGSINHLMVFEQDYLELIGLPPGGEARRPEIAERPLGLDGLACKSDDVERTFAHLESLDMAGHPPRYFSRPVSIDGVEHRASFRTVAVRPGVLSAGRVFFCEHQTPQLVWREPWRSHANGALSVAELIVVAARPEREAARYASLFERDIERTSPGEVSVDLTGSRLSVLDPARYAERFGEAARELRASETMFGALSIRSRNLRDTRERAQACSGSCSIEIRGERLIVGVSEFDAVLEFTG